MNEEFEKWWADYSKKYLRLPLTIMGLFYAFGDCWNASRATMKNEPVKGERFGRCIYGNAESITPCVYENLDDTTICISKNDCPYWREVEG